uniref:Metallothionein n=1 Tax=Hermetia illucens TaxID=343691 RepID=A0A650FPP0_HERIL|nr:metallothionein [Hermetia illucens]
MGCPKCYKDCKCPAEKCGSEQCKCDACCNCPCKGTDTKEKCCK